jgi:Fe-S-cluster-containing dehydrogenase component
MRISRRTLFTGALAAGTATAVAGKAHAHEKIDRPEAVGMLYDATRCIGCRACVTACKEVNGLPFDRSNNGLWDTPEDLSSTTKNIIKVLRADGNSYSFVKRQCMHCVDPSCVSVCMMGALHKEGEGKRIYPNETRGTGIVLYDQDLCVGCRYCQIGCAFNVPRFEWTKAFPKIVKCELCKSRAKAGVKGPSSVANPACCEVCPKEAVIFGYREDLLADAKKRVLAEPTKYERHIYGEMDGGGTQVLYLIPTGIGFEKLGLPALPEESAASFSESVSHAPYLHGFTPIALYAAMAYVMGPNRKRAEEEQNENGHEEGK